MIDSLRIVPISHIGYVIHRGLVNRAPTRRVQTNGTRTGREHLMCILKSGMMYALLFSFVLMMSACTLPGQQQTPQTDPRLKVFHILSSRLTTLDTQAEVDGTVQNTGHLRFPFDVSITASFYDFSGNVIGQAQGIAEDVGPGMTRSFVLVGRVDSAKYSRMTVNLVSLRERRLEKNLPTPPPVVP